MQHDRQIELARQLKLLDEKEFLACRVDVGHVKVEADFANRHRPFGRSHSRRIGQIAVRPPASRTAGECRRRRRSRHSARHGGFCHFGRCRPYRIWHDDAFHPGGQRRRMHLRRGRHRIRPHRGGSGCRSALQEGEIRFGRGRSIISASAAAEPQAIVQPSVPWPVFSHRLP
jgi:hypothetical protein